LGVVRRHLSASCVVRPPPADFFWIFFGSVLRIVNEKVGVIEEFCVSQILPGDIPVAGCQHARVRFVITGIHQRCAVDLQAVTKRKRWMIQITCGDFDIIDREGAFGRRTLFNRFPVSVGGLQRHRPRLPHPEE
jgi:hypothetical protein